VRGKKLSDNNLKFGFTQMRLVEELPVSKFMTTQRMIFGILCIKEIFKNKKWNRWADNWLSNKDRTDKAVILAAGIADTAYGVARTGTAVRTACSAYAITVAAFDIAYRASYTAADVAVDAVEIAHINLVKIAKQAMKFKEN